MTNRPVLIFIPGVGDRSRAYEVFAWVWRRLGFDVHIIAFGWLDRDSLLAPKMEAFLRKLDMFGDEPVAIIGVSAGGTAAINALAARKKKVHKVIVVCTPLNTLPDLQNPLLAASIEKTRANLAALHANEKTRVLSAYALYDQVVRVRLSKTDGVRLFRIWSVLHAPSVFVALVFCAPRLRRFIKRAKTPSRYL